MNNMLIVVKRKQGEEEKKVYEELLEVIRECENSVWFDDLVENVDSGLENAYFLIQGYFWE